MEKKQKKEVKKKRRKQFEKETKIEGQNLENKQEKKEK